MPRYKVSGYVKMWCSIEVEADDEDGAVEAASEHWPGLSDYAGNGANHGRLIGHAEDNVEITAPEDTPDWDEDDIEEVSA